MNKVMKELEKAITLDQVREALKPYNEFQDENEGSYLDTKSFAFAVEFESQSKSVNEIIAGFKKMNGIK